MIIELNMCDDTSDIFYYRYQNQLREEVLIDTSKIVTVQKYRDLIYLENFPDDEIVESGLIINGTKIPVGAYFEPINCLEMTEEHYLILETYASMFDYLYKTILNAMRESSLEFIQIDGTDLFHETQNKLKAEGNYDIIQIDH